jgi:hypothetical protein
MITYPLALDVFIDTLPIESVQHRPGNQQELSGQGSGALLAADVAPALREYDVSTAPMENGAAAQAMALIEALGGSIQPFYLYDPRAMYPQADPDGSLLGSSTVTILALNANNKAMRLTGLPSGYKITAGDMLAWDYGSNPVRRAYHRAVETVTAAGTGATPEFEVRDFIRPGSITGAEVTLIKPAMKCKMVPGTLSDIGISILHTRISFSVRQVI